MNRTGKVSTVILVLTVGLLCGCGETPDESAGNDKIVYKVILGSGDSVYPIDEAKYSRPVETGFIDVPAGMLNRAGYDQLDESGQNVYNLLLTAMKNCSPTAKVPNIDGTGKLYNRILELIRRENPAMFHIESRSIGDKSITSRSFDIEFTYKYSAYEVNTMLREAEKAADKIMVEITGDMDEYDIVKLFHDSLVINCKNDEDAPYADNIYGALVDGRAHCEGYAKAFSYLCGRAGIENAVVTGRTTTDHMWNMVKIEGNWYHVDVTWDHPPEEISAAYPDAVMYNYFLLSDAEITKERTIDSNLTVPPRATGSVMNYYFHEGLYADSYEAAVNCIENGCMGAVEKGSHIFTVKVATDELYKTVLNGLTARSEDNGTDLSRAMSDAGFTGKITYTDMYSSDRILMFMLEY